MVEISAWKTYNKPKALLSFSNISTGIRLFSLGNFYIFPFHIILVCLIMRKRLIRARTRSEKPIVENCIYLGLLTEKERKVSSFSNANIDMLRSSGKFHQGTIFRVHGKKIKNRLSFFILGLLLRASFLHWSLFSFPCYPTLVCPIHASRLSYSILDASF